jgi:hypothetical protein
MKQGFERQPELREQFEKDLRVPRSPESVKLTAQLPLNDRKRFFELLN